MKYTKNKLWDYAYLKNHHGNRMVGYHFFENILCNALLTKINVLLSLNFNSIQANNRICKQIKQIRRDTQTMPSFVQENGV